MTTLPNPSAGTDAVTLADGRHLLVYNHTPKGRTPLNVAISSDGKTWSAAAVLEREPTLAEAGGPADKLEMSCARRREGLLGQLPAGPVDGDRGVRALVRIDADDDHLRCCLLIRGDTPDRPVDTPEWGRIPRSYEVTPVGPTYIRQRADREKATPVGGQRA